MLEYGSVLWDSYTAGGYIQLESIQRTFLIFAVYLLKLKFWNVHYNLLLYKDLITQNHIRAQNKLMHNIAP